MALYRYQVVSVSLWRGKVKRFNNTFYTTSSGAIIALYNGMQKLGYKEVADAVGACSGGVASIAVYNAAGGPPISKTVYFDWEVPGTWIPYTGTVWASVPVGTPVDASGESALILWSLLPGLSATGKPMSIRKYLHAVPSRSAADYSDPDISTADLTAIKAALANTYAFSPRGAQGSTWDAEPYYGNHQRVRGRRRTSSAVAAQSFSAGVVVGSGAPFPEPRIEFLNGQ